MTMFKHVENIRIAAVVSLCMVGVLATLSAPYYIIPAFTGALVGAYFGDITIWWQNR